MRTITRLYNRIKDRKKPTKYGIIMPREKDGIDGYMATASTLTGGSVWRGGKLESEECFFTDRKTARNWLEMKVGDEGQTIEITFIEAEEG